VLFSLLGYLTVSLILMIIKAFGSTSAEIVKSLRKICQIVLSFLLFPKPLSWKHLMGGWLVAVALYWLQRQGKGGPARQPVPPEPKSPGGRRGGRRFGRGL
jgi:adenosine 3'-phospho 5'-phosphosulfate transporter B3